MGQADDFLQSFFKQYPKAKSGQLSMDELNRLMAVHQQKLNDQPLADFDNVSPSQMHHLLHFALDRSCILQLRPGAAQYIDRIPLFKLSELLLSAIQDAGALKLTATGNLPVKVCEMLFGQQLITWRYMHHLKRVREEEIPYLRPLKQCLLDQGILKKRNNALSLTKQGEKLMQETALARFKSFFLYFTGSFPWANFYQRGHEESNGQLGWAYALLLLSRYGVKPHDSKFYALKAMIAFDPGLFQKRNDTGYTHLIDLYCNEYSYCFFECFADWFGLVSMERNKHPQVSYYDQIMITKSELFELIFMEVKPH